MKIAWITDPHLDHYAGGSFYADLPNVVVDVVLVTGDIASAPSVIGHLTELADLSSKPIYFVLGNHDFYYGTIGGTRERIRQTCRKIRQLCYLPDQKPISIDDHSCLIGVDGWGDAGYGMFMSPNAAWLSDYDYIADLAVIRDRKQLQAKLLALGRTEARKARALLEKAIESADRILFATHVPPFIEATWHEGKHSDEFCTPCFACKAVGDVLIEFAEANPNKTFIVLCGHSHSEGTSTIRPNLIARTASAEYGYPKIYTYIE